MRRPLLGFVSAFLLLLGTTAFAALGQPAELIADIAAAGTDSQDLVLSSSPPVVLDGLLYFVADDGVHSWELWRTDGTPGGTSMVSDICPGECASSLSAVLISHGGSIYFAADDGVHGSELWRSDGTENGTTIVHDTVPGLPGANPRWITPLGESLLFVARKPDHGPELWITDGSSTGTELVTELHSAGPSEPASFVTWNGIAYFVASDPVHGSELWRSDGTSAGTWIVRDIGPGPADGLSSDQTPLTNLHTPVVLGDHLLFSANDGAHGSELWRTDGSEGGTEPVRDIQVGSQGSGILYLTPFAGAVYFSANDSLHGTELWRSDGTEGGTTVVRDIEPGTQGSSPRQLTVAGDRLFFAAATTDKGSELWRTDGTEQGTELVLDINPGTASGLHWTSFFTSEPLGNRVLFAADDGVHGLEPWISDGTPNGTVLLGDLNAGAGWAFSPFYDLPIYRSFGDRSFFFATGDTVGRELWSTDGTPAGTQVVLDIDRQASSFPREIFFRPAELVDVGGTLFFRADDRIHGSELWRSDGTAGGTEMVADTAPGDRAGSFPNGLTALGDRVLYVSRADSSQPSHLWSSDGTGAGTGPVVGSGATNEPLGPYYLTRFGEAVFFNAEDSSDAPAVWRSDGTEAGTAPFPPTASQGSAQALEPVGDLLFLAFPHELWRSDGSPSGTTEKLADVDATIPDAASSLLFFAGDDGTTGVEPWVSDGTVGGTRRLRDIRPGAEGSIDLSARFLGATFSKPPAEGPLITAIPTRDAAFFVADDGIHGQELWWTDGTEEGTVLLRDIFPGQHPSNPRFLTVVNEVGYFVADDGVHGAELWRSDGTPAGTFLLADLEPGPRSSLPASLTQVFGHLIFSAWRSDDGRELWVSAGTAEETVRLQDIHPGEGSSSPSTFTLSGGRLFFTANDGERGFEPWALPATPPEIVATMTVSGNSVPGGVVTYTIVLTNIGTFGQLDNPGPELVDVLPPELTVLGVTAATGTATVRRTTAGTVATRASAIGTEVTWSGAVPGQGTVVVTIEARIDPGVQVGTTLANQATVQFDGDGNGENDRAALTDDPAADGSANPTLLVIGAANALGIPSASGAGLALLALFLAALGLGLLRR